MKIKTDFSLKSYNTFNVECFAKRFVEINTLEDYTQVVEGLDFENDKILILGGGSNLLFTQDFDGLVIHPKIKGVEVLSEDEENVTVRVGAGEVWEDFVEHAVEQTWFGIENLALIPGLMGAAPMQNIGAYGVELKDVFDHLRAIDLKTGELKTFSLTDCEFGYRTSIFKTRLKDQYLIYDVSLKLSKKPVVNISYKALSHYFEEYGLTDVKPFDVFEAVVKIRNSKLPDPEKLGNAGSFFKNPIVSVTDYQFLKAEFPEIVVYPLDDGKYKLAAGWLIDQAGYRGMRKGNVGVHKDQALVLVNYGGASGKEISDFSEIIINVIKRIFGVQLEAEVNIV